jgi:hypothetical protein
VVQFALRPPGFLAIHAKGGNVWLYDIETKRTEHLGQSPSLDSRFSRKGVVPVFPRRMGTN